MKVSIFLLAIFLLFGCDEKPEHKYIAPSQQRRDSTNLILIRGDSVMFIVDSLKRVQNIYKETSQKYIDQLNPKKAQLYLNKFCAIQRVIIHESGAADSIYRTGY